MRAVLLAAALALVPAALAAQDHQVIRLGDAPAPGPFSPGIRAGNLVFVSGTLGTVPGTRNLVPGGIAAETRQALQNIDQVLHAAGTSMAKMVKCTVFLADITEWPAMNTVYATFFPTDPPARTAVEVSHLLFGARVEFECVATM